MGESAKGHVWAQARGIYIYINKSSQLIITQSLITKPTFITRKVMTARRNEKIDGRGSLNGRFLSTVLSKACSPKYTTYTHSDRFNLIILV